MFTVKTPDRPICLFKDPFLKLPRQATARIDYIWQRIRPKVLRPITCFKPRALLGLVLCKESNLMNCRRYIQIRINSKAENNLWDMERDPSRRHVQEHVLLSAQSLTHEPVTENALEKEHYRNAEDLANKPIGEDSSATSEAMLRNLQPIKSGRPRYF